MEAGATKAEIRQALMLIAPTVGFPNVIAALSWAEDVFSTFETGPNLTSKAAAKKRAR